MSLLESVRRRGGSGAGFDCPPVTKAKAALRARASTSFASHARVNGRGLLCVFIAAALSACAAVPTEHAKGKSKLARAEPGVTAAHKPDNGAAHTAGGNGGRIVRVTNLGADGEGSLKAAIESPWPRTIVFEVGGVIDLAGHALNVKNPYVTIAGQTAPSPGITLIRGGIDVRTHDVVIEHLRVRTGEAGFAERSGWERDGFSTYAGAANVVVDHCSFAWATDENLSASGKRFDGTTPDAWRAATSHNIIYSNNIIAEGLANSTHSKGEHSKGTLVHDNVSDILIVGNLYAHNNQRNPLFKGGTRGAFVNNYIFDPGKRAVHYNLWATEWGDHPYQTGRLALIGNVLHGGASTDKDIALFMLGGEGDVELYAADNLAIDAHGKPLPLYGSYHDPKGRVMPLATQPPLPLDLKPLPATAVVDAVLARAGARPSERDAVDMRIVEEARHGDGKVIDSETEREGYPAIAAPTRRTFVEAEWDLATMQPRRRP